MLREPPSSQVLCVLSPEDIRSEGLGKVLASLSCAVLCRWQAASNLAAQLEKWNIPLCTQYCVPSAKCSEVLLQFTLASSTRQDSPSSVDLNRYLDHLAFLCT